MERFRFRPECVHWAAGCGLPAADSVRSCSSPPGAQQQTLHPAASGRTAPDPAWTDRPAPADLQEAPWCWRPGSEGVCVWLCPVLDPALQSKLKVCVRREIWLTCVTDDEICEKKTKKKKQSFIYKWKLKNKMLASFTYKNITFLQMFTYILS